MYEEPVAADETSLSEDEEEQDMPINGNEEVRDEIIDEDNEGLLFVPEDNVVSDDETFIENDTDTVDDLGAVVQTNEDLEEVVVADVDDGPAENSRPRRANAGAGFERLQMDFQGKGYEAKREYNFTSNSTNTGEKGEVINSADSYMKLACDVVFTQMTAKRGFK